jgi:hypothetical protein
MGADVFSDHSPVSKEGMAKKLCVAEGASASNQDIALRDAMALRVRYAVAPNEPPVEL